MEEVKAPNLATLIDRFILTIEASGDVESEATVTWNRHRIELFARFVEEEQVDEPLTAETFLKYAAYLKHRPRFDAKSGPLSVYYRHGCVRVLKRFGKWLFQQGYTKLDPAVS